LMTEEETRGKIRGTGHLHDVRAPFGRFRPADVREGERIDIERRGEEADRQPYEVLLEGERRIARSGAATWSGPRRHAGGRRRGGSATRSARRWRGNGELNQLRAIE